MGLTNICVSTERQTDKLLELASLWLFADRNNVYGEPLSDNGTDACPPFCNTLW